MSRIEKGIVAYDTTISSHTAKYIFVAEEEFFENLNYGVVEKIILSIGICYVVIEGEKYIVDEESLKFEIMRNFLKMC